VKSVVLSSTGYSVPQHSISNEELVTSFNQYVDYHNQNAAKNSDLSNSQNINQNTDQNNDLSSTQNAAEALQYSSAEFIQKASGIKNRYVIDKEGILDIHKMRPQITQRPDHLPSIQCEMATEAAKMALERAHISPKDIDFLLVASSVTERSYPAMSIEIQNALGIEGFAFDMNAACSSATFGIQTALNTIQQGQAKTVLMVNPELCTAHINFRDRDSHFIFGDACTAVVIQAEETCKSQHPYRILGSQLKTQFSNNIRNNFGILTPLDPANRDSRDKQFMQQGRKVFKEVVPWVSELVLKHLADLGLSKEKVKRLWLHQANANMNRLIATKVLDREPEFLDAPTILEEFANTSSPGSIIAFHQYHEDLQKGDLGILCAFGAGYSVGNIVLEKC
jgi:beta-ketodecanoyl-[acyl-carrier-protein] synthase